MVTVLDFRKRHKMTGFDGKNGCKNSDFFQLFQAFVYGTSANMRKSGGAHHKSLKSLIAEVEKSRFGNQAKCLKSLSAEVAEVPPIYR